MKPTLILLLTLGLCTLSTHLSAVVVVNWGGDYVSANQNFARTGTAFAINSSIDPVNNSSYMSLSESVAMSPSSDYSGTSSRFYGGYTFVQKDSNPERTNRITDSTTADYIQILTRRVDAAQIVMWQKADFLNGGEDNPVGVEAGSELSITTRRTVSSNFRFLIKNDGQYYLSATSYNPGSLTTTTLSLNTAEFYDYAVSDGSINLFFTPPVDPEDTVVGSAFQDIQAVGYVYFANASSGNAIDTSGFSANLAVIPESATTSLLLGLFVVIGTVAWRKYRLDRASA